MEKNYCFKTIAEAEDSEGDRKIPAYLENFHGLISELCPLSVRRSVWMNCCSYYRAETIFQGKTPSRVNDTSFKMPPPIDALKDATKIN